MTALNFVSHWTLMTIQPSAFVFLTYGVPALYITNVNNDNWIKSMLINSDRLDLYSAHVRQ